VILALIAFLPVMVGLAVGVLARTLVDRTRRRANSDTNS